MRLGHVSAHFAPRFDWGFSFKRMNECVHLTHDISGRSNMDLMTA